MARRRRTTPRGHGRGHRTPRASSPARSTRGSARPKLDLAVLRSTVPAVGPAMFTANRVQAAPVLVSKAHLAQAEPQAVVINSGVANAATGKQGELDALATAAETAALLGLEPEQVLVLSTGVIGVKLPMPKLLAGLGEIELVAGRRRRRRRGDPHHRHLPEGVARLARRLHGRRDGEGRRDDPPVPGDDARRRHHRLPARRRRGARVPQARRERELQPDLGRRRVLDERRRPAARERRERDRAHAATDRDFAAALGEVCADLSRQIVIDGEGATVLLEIAVTRRRERRRGEAIARRIATSPLVKTAALRARPELGPDPRGGRLGVRRGRLRAVDVDRLTLQMNGVDRLRRGRADRRRGAARGAGLHDRARPRARRSEATYLASDLTYDYVRINAEYTT